MKAFIVLCKKDPVFSEAQSDSLPTTDEQPYCPNRPLNEHQDNGEFDTMLDSGFSVGNMVYLLTGNSTRAHIVAPCNNHQDIMVNGVKYTRTGRVSPEDETPVLVEATEENRTMLSALLGIEFDKPSLIGDGLVRYMLERGCKNVLCWHADKKVIIDQLNENGELVNSNTGLCYKNLVPINWFNNRPLTKECADGLIPEMPF